MANLGRLFRRSPAHQATDPRRDADADANADNGGARSLDDIESKPFLQRAMPVFACGAGLFSDGYINNVSRRPLTVVARGYKTRELERQDRVKVMGTNLARWRPRLSPVHTSADKIPPQVIGSVNTVLKLQYGAVYKNSRAAQHVADIAFAGTVIGQLVFGFTSDRWSRSNSLVLSTMILIVFTALTAGSYYRGEPVGMFNMLAAWRFFVGIGIGGWFPRRAGSRLMADCVCR